MNNFLARLDKWIMSIITGLVGISVIILTLVVFFQVIARYVLKMSVDGLQELPTFLLIFTVWLAAAMNARKKGGHIKLELIEIIIKNPKVIKAIEIFIDVLTIAALAIFAYLCLEYVQYGIETGEASIGLKMPMWWLTSVLLVGVVLMIIYNIMHVYKEFRK